MKLVNFNLINRIFDLIKKALSVCRLNLIKYGFPFFFFCIKANYEKNI